MSSHARRLTVDPRPVRLQPAAQPEHKTEATGKTADTNQKQPQRSTFLSRVRSTFATKTGVVLSIAAVAIVGTLTTNAVISHLNDSKKTNTDDSGHIVENIEYQTVLPEGKSITSLGGWKRVSPSDGEPVYAYVDTISGVTVSVSQQPLPDTFKGSTDDNVAKVAKKFNATNKLEAGNTTAYIGTSAKGPQSVIFSRNGLLILIKSQKQIDNKAWISYIESLQ